MIFLTSFYCLLSVYFQKQRDDFQNGKKEITYQKKQGVFRGSWAVHQDDR